MGVQASECEEVARLIGLKTIVNEFVAYEQLGKVKISPGLSVSIVSVNTHLSLLFIHLFYFIFPGFLSVISINI